ncbi:MAG: HAMP domain-containing protein [Methylococcales bacterium]|jgi:nitrogen fixation/metabolism regulation signal transduction histidine kinase|nr:HAMP domain-containing protein [Methylococcales bacterium]MBT7411097.1 HAMP domain-containing protein [Methylococcales bacterium]
MITKTKLLFLNLPLKHKLSLLIVGTTLITMGIGLGLLLTNDIHRLKLDLKNRVKTNAELMANYLVVPMAFDDKEGALHLLESVNLLQEVLDAQSYTKNNNAFNRIIKDRNLNPSNLPLSTLTNFFADNMLHTIVPIYKNNIHYGKLYLRSSTQILDQTINFRITLVIFLLLVMTLFAFLIANKLQQLISVPIKKLALISLQVRDSADYSQRVSPDSIDEIGQLYTSFNALLEAIQTRETERDCALKDLAIYSDQLEELVEKRTDALRQTQTELIQKERLAVLGQLTATVAHELRNPLGTIRLSIFNVSQQINADSPSVNRSIKRIERNIQRCDQIIKELLLYTKHRPLDLTEVDLSNWIHHFLSENPFHQDIKLKLDLTSNLMIKIDTEKIRQVMVNLLNNASEALLEQTLNTPKPAILKISCQQKNKGIECIIADNGPGMNKETQARIFEPLFSTKGFGVGLGLPIVEQIITQHGGSLHVESRLEQGTKMKYWIPY